MEAIRDLLSGCKLEAVAHRNASMLLTTKESTPVVDAVKVIISPMYGCVAKLHLEIIELPPLE